MDKKSVEIDERIAFFISMSFVFRFLKFIKALDRFQRYRHTFTDVPNVCTEICCEKKCLNAWLFPVCLEVEKLNRANTLSNTFSVVRYRSKPRWTWKSIRFFRSINEWFHSVFSLFSGQSVDGSIWKCENLHQWQVKEKRFIVELRFSFQFQSLWKVFRNSFFTFGQRSWRFERPWTIRFLFFFKHSFFFQHI